MSGHVRAVLSLRLLDLQQSEAEFAALPADRAAGRECSYAFEGDPLTLTVKDSKGRVTAVNAWRTTK